MLEKIKNLKTGHKILLASLAAVLVLAAVAVILIAAFAGGEEPNTEEPEKATYTVTVTDETGAGLLDVGVYVYTDATKAELVWYARTDAEGKISFADVKSDGYVAFLVDAPDGYELKENYPLTGENTVISLSRGTLDSFMDSITFQLGDTILDFTVTDVKGNTYKLSQLLEQKKAVMLNFWYLNCNPCKMEFPALQEAYEAYSDQLEILAIDAYGDTADKISDYQNEAGLTFPMIQGDSRWLKVMDVKAFPTTVIIDRTGTISLIHEGAVTDAQTFKDIFAYFTSDSYEPVVLDSFDEIYEIETGTESNPLEFGGVTEFKVDVEPGKIVYANVYKVSQMLLQIEDADVYLVYNGETYKPENGKISLVVASEDVTVPVLLGIGNSGSGTKTVKISFSVLEGSQNNPLTMEIGKFTVNVEAENSQGMYYTWQAAENGTVTLKCLESTSGVKYGFTLYNLTSSVYRTLAEDGKDGTLSIDVSAGDTLQFHVKTESNDENKHPAATFRFEASFVKKEGGSTGGEVVVSKIPYTVKVTDELGNAISGVSVTLSGDETVTITTDDNGKATATLTAGTYSVTVTAPSGYLANSTQYTLTKDETSVTVTMIAETVEEEYTELYVGFAYHVGLGTNNVKLSTETESWFLFQPEKSGVYKISCTGGTLKYYGSNTAFIHDQTSDTDMSNNTFNLTVKEDNLGASYLLSITSFSATSGKLTIARTSDAPVEMEDLPYEIYKGKHKPTSFTFSGDKDALTYVDITGKTEDFVLIKEGEFYYLNGKQVYVNLSLSAPYELSLQGIVESERGVIQAHAEYDGGIVKKEDYTDLVNKYVQCMDKTTGLYYLTDDLIHILKQFGADQSWWVQGWLINQEPELNKDIAWMYACCY